MSLYDPNTLSEAIEGFREFSRRFGQLAGEVEDAAASRVRFLRGIPAGDSAKKDELRKFFDSEEGQRYSKAERKKFYDDLLGAQRNRETIG